LRYKDRMLPVMYFSLIFQTSFSVSQTNEASEVLYIASLPLCRQSEPKFDTPSEVGIISMNNELLDAIIKWGCQSNYLI